MIKLRPVLAVVALSMMAAAPAFADTTYTYTGPDFTAVAGSFTTSDSIDGYVTLSAPLGDNLYEQSASYFTFSFSDGVDTFTPANTYANDDEFFFSTDAAGNITGFEFTAQESGTPYQAEIDVETYASGPKYTAYGGGGDGYNLTSQGSFGPGVTIGSATPEPGGLALLGTGVLGVAGVVRRRLGVASLGDGL